MVAVTFGFTVMVVSPFPVRVSPFRESDFLDVVTGFVVK